jgi:hypothetical protein
LSKNKANAFPDHSRKRPQVKGHVSIGHEGVNSRSLKKLISREDLELEHISAGNGPFFIGFSLGAASIGLIRRCKICVETLGAATGRICRLRLLRRLQ